MLLLEIKLAMSFPCFVLCHYSMSNSAVSPDILSAPARQYIPRGSPSGTVECQVTGGSRTVIWWKNQLFIASSDPSLSTTTGKCRLL